ncbi:hypothetical protein IVB03_27615 [Bradyrhizobium sp. 168]|uniref:hypothetical protein n=1 Tax=Bradyrhizobium sp. 168 TaxID=2782639 RepID=UPI001FFAF031|nr:hypothetical protein [Bradyrhizobium sp. 168]MCK1583227.1 hypothetical protein [Bradyrhizobium sp. 168]
MSAIVHHLITSLFVYTMVGSLVWVVVYSYGHLARVYDEPSGSGEVVDGLANIIITLTLILGWPGMLGVVLHWTRQRRARR